MGIDGLKSGIASIFSKVVQELEPAKPAPPPPPPPKPVEEFTDAKKKPMSLTGKHTPFQPSGPAKAELSSTVSTIRSLAQSGVTTNAIGLGRDTPATPNGDALKAAIDGKSDSKIRKLVNDNPALLKELTPEQKGKALEVLRSGYTDDADQLAMVNIVRSCETKGELLAVLQAAAGGVGQKEMHKFDKQMTDYHPFLIADLLNEANTSLPKVHPKSISANDHIGSRADYPSANPNDSVSLKPGDEAARKKFIDGLTQVNKTSPADDPHDEGCGAACIVGSALQSTDPKAALSKLCDYNQKNMVSRLGVGQFDKDKGDLTDLKKRIDAGEPVTKKDLDLLQRTTYESLRAKESKIPGANADNGPIDVRAVKMVFDESGIGTSGGVPRLVDTDQAPEKSGKTTADHFVLVKNGEIYDPWPRKDGKQIIAPGSDAAKRYEQSFAD